MDRKKGIVKRGVVALLGEVLWERTKNLKMQGMGGLEVGAMPMAWAAAIRYHAAGRSLESFFVRKQAKEHGSKQRVEGLVKQGDRVAVVDDVLTTGGSLIQAIEEVEKLGARIVAVLC